MVDSKHHACAVEWVITVCKCGIIVVILIPKTFTSNSDALSCNLAKNCLNNNFVCRNWQRLYISLNLANNRFNGCLCFRVTTIFFTFKILFHNIFDNYSYFWWVESINILRNKSFFRLTYLLLLVLNDKCTLMIGLRNP